MNRDVICIAGAHRSGTSMLARLLHDLGLELGPPGDIMPAQPDNPDGFWENLRFVAINDEVLNQLGGAWDLPPAAREDFSDVRFRQLWLKAQLLIESFSDKPVWGWKDPRNCLTLPFWRSLLPGLKPVVIVRNPLEVAYSMHKRNGTSYALGLRLWEIYNRRILANTQPNERMITNYQAFFDAPEQELAKIAAFAGLPATEITAAANLVATNRRHTTFTVEQMIDAGVSQEIVTLYQSLTTGSDEGTVRGSPPAVTARRDPLAGAESKLNTFVPDSEDIRRELAKLRGDEIRHRETIAQHQEVIEGLRKELNAQTLRATAEINLRDGRIEELQKAEAQRGELLGELAKVRDRFQQTNQLLQTLSIRLAENETRNTSLTDRLRKQLLELKKLLRLFDQVDAAADRLRRSRRWKLANPFMALRAALTGRPLEGFGHLDKNVEKYRAWRSAHPETASLEDEIQALRLYGTAQPAPLPATGSVATQPSPTAKPLASTTPIEFVRPEEAEVSIIIPVFNQVEFTQACLASLQQHGDGIPYEVIVVDDASTDATRDVLSKIGGLTCLRAEANAGFIASCNRGAEAARGKFLVFLNNDTVVKKGWLASLLETFRLEPKAGLVGSKLVYPDGRLQEAGGIVWRDGSAWNRGKFRDPTDPEYNYLREMDYCSAASVMIPRSLFATLGGFEAKYSPGYYEDTDLAFKVRRHGSKALYQPLSEVIHYEGATGGTDLSTGPKKHQEINRHTFVDSWASELARLPANGDVAEHEKLGPGQKHILVIDHHLPMIDRDAGSVRMFHIVKILHDLGHRVTFLPDNLADIPPYGDELRKRGIEVMHHPYCKSIRDYLEEHGPRFEVVILSRCDFARKHIADVRRCAPQSRIIFDTVDLHHLRLSREAELTQDSAIKAAAEVTKRQEYVLIDEADETWVVSGYEQDLLKKERPEKSIEVVPTIVDTPGSTTPFALRHDFLFIGSFQHTPNVDAVLFFTNEVFPLVITRLPGVKFYIIGDKAPPEVIALASEHIVITGLQPDVKPYFESVRLSIAPLRFGAGVKGKINQSMGFGVPVVATSLAIEGMGLSNRQEILVADNPKELAEAIIELYESRELWERISQMGLEKTNRLYSEEAAKAVLTRLLTEQRTPRPHGKLPRPISKSFA